MNIYSFTDKRTGRAGYIIARNRDDAYKMLAHHTDRDDLNDCIVTACKTELYTGIAVSYMPQVSGLDEWDVM